MWIWGFPSRLRSALGAYRVIQTRLPEKASCGEEAASHGVARLPQISGVAMGGAPRESTAVGAEFAGTPGWAGL